MIFNSNFNGNDVVYDSQNNVFVYRELSIRYTDSRYYVEIDKIPFEHPTLEGLIGIIDRELEPSNKTFMLFDNNVLYPVPVFVRQDTVNEDMLVATNKNNFEIYETFKTEVYMDTPANRNMLAQAQNWFRKMKSILSSMETYHNRWG